MSWLCLRRVLAVCLRCVNLEAQVFRSSCRICLMYVMVVMRTFLVFASVVCFCKFTLSNPITARAIGNFCIIHIYIYVKLLDVLSAFYQVVLLLSSYDLFRPIRVSSFSSILGYSCLKHCHLQQL